MIEVNRDTILPFLTKYLALTQHELLRPVDDFSLALWATQLNST